MSSIPYFIDRVQESSTTVGTGAYTLAGVITGFQAFSALGDGNSCYYSAEAVDSNGNPSGDWETGVGTYISSGTTLSRDTILASSNSNNPVNWGVGIKRIFVTYPANQIVSSLYPACPTPLIRPTLISITQFNLPIGNNDLYTVPSGRRAILRCFAVNNTDPGIGSVSLFHQVKVAGTYYRLRPTVPISNIISSLDLQVNIILEPGDVYSLSTASSSGLNLWGQIIEFDVSSALKGARLLGLATGDNTLYTCPAGKRAFGVGPYFPPFGGLSTMMLVADSGGTRTFKIMLVPSGSSPSAKYRVNTDLAVNASSVGVATGVPYIMTPGDFININVNTGDTSQSVWQAIVEIDS